MLNNVLLEGIIGDVRCAGRYTEISLSDCKGHYFPVYTREKLGKENIAKHIRVGGVLEAISCMWRGLESKKVVVLADFINFLQKN